MNPLIQQLISMGIKNLPSAAKAVGVNFLAPVGLMSGSAYYHGRELPGSQRNWNYPNVPSPAEDAVNAAWLAATPMSPGLGLIGMGMNPLVQELWDKNKQYARYEKNYDDAQRYAQGLARERQGIADFKQLEALTNDQHQQAINIAADMRKRGATVNQIKEALKTRKQQVTPGDILRGNQNWNANWPSGFRSASKIPNDKVLIKNTNNQ